MISDFFTNTNNTIILSSVLDKLTELVQDKSLPETAQKHIEDIILAGDISHSQFMQYLAEKGSQDDTWQLWTNFLLCDCFAYIGLYVAIRGSNWKLRNASLKLMAPLFYAFDRGTYERIIPDHLSNLHKYPHEIIKCFEAGGFTVNINDRRWHSVAFDEAHEMCVNKDLKGAIARPTKPYLQKTSLFFNYRIKALKILKPQLFPDDNPDITLESIGILENTTEAVRKEQNIEHMYKEIIEANLLPSHLTSNRGLMNTFSMQTATLEQTHDMLNFQSIDEEALDHYITFRVLGIPSVSSTNAPLRHLTKRKLSQKDKENKLVNTCLRRRLAWSNCTGLTYDSSKEQYSLYPRALADECGIRYKASKSIWTDKLRTRYHSTNPPIFLNALPTGWVPQISIIDAMFLINTKPLRNTKSICDYTKFLFNRFVLQHFHASVSEVHLIFDKPGRQQFNPKQFEQSRRDKQNLMSTNPSPHNFHT